MNSADATATRTSETHPLTAGQEPPCLVQLSGPALGKKFVLDQAETVIGRSDSCAIKLELDNVSRRHCSFVAGAGDVVLLDHGSTNGTYVNNVRISAEARLLSGDLIKVGSAIFKFLSSGELGSIEAQYHEEIYRLTIVDGLTQVHNKRYLLEFLEREMARCARHGCTLSLAMIDIDHFKRVNDDFGHLAGDAVLRELGLLLQVRVRKDECLARYGGEEFALVLPETSLGRAVDLVDKLRLHVEAHSFVFEDRRLPVTFSAGVAELVPGEESALAFIKAADRRLYEAKAGGRNRVVGEPG
jgi:two-component system, cell cycle response regulator